MNKEKMQKLQEDLNRVLKNSQNKATGCLVIRTKIIMQKWLSKMTHVPYAIYEGLLDIRNLEDFFRLPAYIEIFIWIHRSELYRYEGFWLEVSSNMFKEAIKNMPQYNRTQEEV